MDFRWFTTELLQVVGEPFDGDLTIFFNASPGMSGARGRWLR